MNGLKVIKAGIFTLLQDNGRFGFMDKGITQSGVMDIYAYNFLNKLLENEKDTNCLEIVFGGLEFASNMQSYFAVTGAKCELSINGEAKENWTVHKIDIGDSIKIGKIVKGQRVYFGVKGGFEIKKELGSVSTTIKESIGGIDGDKIKNGDFLPCKSFETTSIKKVAKKYIPKYENELTLRVILGYQEDSFNKEEKEKFFSTTYEITPQISRMGYKLKGEPINSSLNGIISEAISYGSIQIPKDGQPIILLNDRQTIGGYPKIGTLLPIDCYKLAQANVGCKIRFQEMSLEEAIQKQKAFCSYFN